MKTNRKVPTTFGPDIRFAVQPAPSAPFRALHESAFEHLNYRLLREKLAESWDADTNLLIRRAAHEAAALAWTTPYPLLVFPELFEEKTAVNIAHSERQAEVRRLSSELLAL